MDTGHTVASFTQELARASGDGSDAGAARHAGRAGPP